MNVPAELRYTKDHEWCRLKGNVATVGITHHAQDQLGDIVYLELPEVGASVKRGQPFGVVESTKAVSDLFAPVTGKVVASNRALADAPEGINAEPYGKGWMLEIEIADPKEIDALLDAAAYVKLVESEAH